MRKFVILALLLNCFSFSVSVAQDAVITNELDTIHGNIIEHTLKTVRIQSLKDNKKRNFRIGQVKSFHINGVSFSRKQPNAVDKYFLLDSIGKDTSYNISAQNYNVLVTVRHAANFTAYLLTMNSSSTYSKLPSLVATHYCMFENSKLGFREVLGPEDAYANLQKFFWGTVLIADVLKTDGRYDWKFLDKLLQKYTAIN